MKRLVRSITRFSLRTALVALTLLAILFAAIAAYFRPVWNRYLTTVQVQAAGGEVKPAMSTKDGPDHQDDVDIIFKDAKVPRGLLRAVGSNLNVQDIVISNSSCDSLSEIAFCRSLRFLGLETSQAIQLSWLNEMKELSHLAVDNSELNIDRSATAMLELNSVFLKNVANLDLGRFLEQAPNTKSLYLTILHDVRPNSLHVHENLTHLILDNSRIQSLDFLVAFPNLTWLSCRNTQVFDLAPVKRLKNLKHLSLDNTEVQSISDLSGMELLDHLYLGSVVRSIPPDLRLPKLRVIGINGADTSLESIDGLANCPELEEVWFSQTNILDIRPLKHCDKLLSVRVDSPVDDISALMDLKNLGYVYLGSRCRVPEEQVNALKNRVGRPIQVKVQNEDGKWE